MKWGTLNGIKLTREQMEQRRRMAAEDLLAGMKQADVARKYGVNRSNVSRWTKTLREKGNEGLRMRKAKGSKSKLSLNQKKMLVEILVSGAKKYGYKTDLWTSKRVCKVIEKEFEVEYHFKHIPKLLRALDFRPVKPKREAYEKDEKEKQEWINITWERIKKNSRGKPL
jgi:transposase